MDDLTSSGSVSPRELAWKRAMSEGSHTTANARRYSEVVCVTRRSPERCQTCAMSRVSARASRRAGRDSCACAQAHLGEIMGRSRHQRVCEEVVGERAEQREVEAQKVLVRVCRAERAPRAWRRGRSNGKGGGSVRAPGAGGMGCRGSGGMVHRSRRGNLKRRRCRRGRQGPASRADGTRSRSGAACPCGVAGRGDASRRGVPGRVVRVIGGGRA